MLYAYHASHRNIHTDPVTINHPVMKQLFFIIQPGNESRFSPH